MIQLTFQAELSIHHYYFNRHFILAIKILFLSILAISIADTFPICTLNIVLILTISIIANSSYYRILFRD